MTDGLVKLGEYLGSRSVPKSLIMAAFAGALGQVSRQQYRDQMLESQRRVALVVIASHDLEALARWNAEIERRKSVCWMSPGNATESVYQDVIAGRLK